MKNKRFLYTRNPEKHFEKEIYEFDRNNRAIEDLDTSDYKLGLDISIHKKSHYIYAKASMHEGRLFFI